MWACVGFVVLFSFQFISGRELRHVRDPLKDSTWSIDASYNDIDAATARQLNSFETFLSGSADEVSKRARNTIRDSTAPSFPPTLVNNPSDPSTEVNQKVDQDKRARNLNYGVGSYGQPAKQQGSYAMTQPQQQAQLPYSRPYGQQNQQVQAKPVVASWSRNKGYAYGNNNNNRPMKVYLVPAAVRPYAPAPAKQVYYNKPGQQVNNYAQPAAQPLGYAKYPKSNPLPYAPVGQPQYNNYNNNIKSQNKNKSPKKLADSSKANLPDELFQEEEEDEEQEEPEEGESESADDEQPEENPQKEEAKNKLKEKEMVNLINAKVAKLNAIESKAPGQQSSEKPKTRADQGEVQSSDPPAEDSERAASSDEQPTTTPPPPSSPSTEAPEARAAAEEEAEPDATTTTPGETTPSQEQSDSTAPADGEQDSTAKSLANMESELTPPPSAEQESAPESARESGPESTPESSSESTPESSPESAAESTPESASGSAPESAPESARESTPESTRESTPESAPGTPSKSVPESSSSEASQRAVENLEKSSLDSTLERSLMDSATGKSSPIEPVSQRANSNNSNNSTSKQETAPQVARSQPKKRVKVTIKGLKQQQDPASKKQPATESPSKGQNVSSSSTK